VKLMQLGSIVGKAAWDLAQWERTGLIKAAGITVYGVLFLDWKQENPPFQGVCVRLREESNVLI
jgi:hypothetical protein